MGIANHRQKFGGSAPDVTSLQPGASIPGGAT